MTEEDTGLVADGPTATRQWCLGGPWQNYTGATPPGGDDGQFAFGVMADTPGDPLESPWALVLLLTAFAICITGALLAFDLLSPPNFPGALAAMSGMFLVFMGVVRVLYR